MDHTEKAVAVGININDKDTDFEYSMSELKRLAEACHIEVVGQLTQNLKRNNQLYYVGKGKLEELHAMVQALEVDLVIFNDELSPTQIRVLEEKLEKRVIDRTMLILDIFAERARTKEAQLQVEVAQLQYMLPRLVGSRQYLSRQGGGSGVENRGAGETKLELDRRHIEDKIAALNRELEQLVARRKVQRKRRHKNEIPVAALVGYTNAGKSTVMNALVEQFHHLSDKQVFEQDMLFATLETSVRKIKLPDNKTFLLTDTVGFIDKLPHHLVKAFRSTLEEVTEADLIIHVVDYSDPNYNRLIEITNNTLQEIGIRDIPIIYAFNKGDLVEDAEIPRLEHDTVYLSAKQRIGVDELIQLISNHLFTDYRQCEFLVPYDQGQIISYFNEHAHVLDTDYEPNGTRLLVECKESDVEKYQEYVVTS